MTPSVYIATLSENIPGAKDYYKNGGCFKFFKILESKYPEALPYYDGDHVIVKIGEEYYDVTGKVEKVNHLQMTREQQEEAAQWSKEYKIMAETLNTELLKQIADTLGVSNEELTKAISGEEVDFKLNEGDFFSSEQLSTRDSAKYEEGKKAGLEMWVRDAKEKYEYDFTGRDIDSFMAHHNSVLEEKLGKDDSERIEEYKTKIKNQKDAFDVEIKQLQEQNQTIQAQYKKQSLNNQILEIMPKETVIDRNAILTLFHAEHQVKDNEGSNVFVRNGVDLIDNKTTNPLPLESVLNDWITEKNYAKPVAGRGGQNQNGKTAYTGTNPLEFQEQWMKENPGKSVQSPEYQEAYKDFRAKSA